MQNTELKQAIVSQAFTMFRAQGIKAVRMDDVAKSLKISKRTLYMLFNDKEQLLLECVKQNSEIQRQMHISYAKKATGIMDILCFFLKNSLEELSKYNPNFFSDVLKYKSVREFLNQKHEADTAIQEEFMQKGIEENIIVSNINFQLISRINKAALETLINDKIYEQYPPQEIFRTFIQVFLRGMLTENGQRELEKHLGNIL